MYKSSTIYEKEVNYGKKDKKRVILIIQVLYFNILLSFKKY